ncbi:hypothetical protein [Ktedonospora formicarum]|uniref:hypothetical protein n=1 Tax=Ktedonospora formicarum TaxID=2778364 RepID=UPI001C689154|nr:hypothetical protein [Ktedonospora formicarum]
MRVSLAMVDRVVSKLGSVNTLVENLSKRFLPKKEALASGACSYDWCGTTPCGKGGVYYGRYRTYYAVCETPRTVYVACDC